MKTGIVCAEPLGFFDSLAEEYEADLHVTDDVNLELHNGRFDRSSEARSRVNTETERRSLASLEEGNNVVYDGFLNSWNRRQEVRQRVAESTGAVPVLLSVTATDDLIIERIRERHVHNQLSIPSLHIPNVEDTIRVAERMWRDIQWPTFNAEPHVILNGRLPIERLLGRVAWYLGKEGL